ncbi:hypothetical protein, partial [Caulobacter sp.]|uniref:hypothetical protein n=1 Tax=Caulobacter sp. TaxID=78 RepID=UPI0031DD09D8
MVADPAQAQEKLVLIAQRDLPRVKVPGKPLIKRGKLENPGPDLVARSRKFFNTIKAMDPKGPGPLISPSSPALCLRSVVALLFSFHEANHVGLLIIEGGRPWRRSATKTEDCGPI